MESQGPSNAVVNLEGPLDVPPVSASVSQDSGKDVGVLHMVNKCPLM